MAKEIVWSLKAKSSFDSVINYLEKNWTEREIRNFVQRTHLLLKLIASDKVRFRKSVKKNFHEVPVTKHNLLLYRINKDRIELILFFDTRQNPKKKKGYQSHH